MDRLIESFRALVRQCLPEIAYAMMDRYTVVACNVVNQTVDVRSQSTAVPDLTAVALRAPGVILDLIPGTQVRVGYDADGTPYAVLGASGGLPPLAPGSGSGIKNKIDCGYVLIVQLPGTPFTVTAFYFSAGNTGRLEAETAHLGAPGSILLHLDGGRVMPDAWTVP